MREIKFRAWDKKKKQMLLPDIPLNEFVFGINFEKITHPDNLVMLQYIGLKDKKGKEIYEGDILEYQPNSSDIIKDVVSFKNGCFCLGVHPFYSTAPGFGVTDLRKVIGNIYENPELLEAKNEQTKTI